MKRKQKQADKEFAEATKYERYYREQRTANESLSDLNNNHQLRNNDPNVKQAIALHPILSKMTGQQLSNEKKKAKQRENRLREKAAKQVHFPDDSDSDGQKLRNFKKQVDKDPDYDPTQDEKALRGVIGSEPSKLVMKARRRKLDAAAMIKLAHKAEDDSPLRQAVIDRLSEFSSDELHKQKQLKILLVDEQADILARQLQTNDVILVQNSCWKECSPEVIVRAFVNVSQKSAKVVSDQKLLADFLIPALKDAKKYPEYGPKTTHGLWWVLTACLRYYSGQEDPDPPVGLYRFAHSFGQVRECINEFIHSSKMKTHMKTLMHNLSLPKQVVKLIGDDLWNLGFSGLINFCTEVPSDDALQVCTVLKKCDIEIDPSKDAKALNEQLRQKVHIAQALASHESGIPLEPQELIKFLHLAEGLKVQQVKQIIENDFRFEWLEQIQYLRDEKDAGRSADQRDEQKWMKLSEEEGFIPTFKRVADLSQQFMAENRNYRHNPFQCYTAAKLFAQDDRVSVLVSPTGSGKTYIACLLAKLFVSCGQRVAFITTHLWLADQAEDLIGEFRHQIKVVTLEQALITLDQYDVAILDESDELIINGEIQRDPVSKKMLGFWDLLQKKAILLTATASHDLQTLLKGIYDISPSRYVDVATDLKLHEKKKSPVNFVYDIQADDQEHLERIEAVIAEHYMKQPVIVFCDSAKVLEFVTKTAQSFGIPKFFVRNDIELKSARVAIRSHTRGIAIVKRMYGRGSDIRFAEDSMVLTTFLPIDIVEATQLAGRSSRTFQTHTCVIIFKSDKLTSYTVEEHLIKAGKGSIGDGLRVLKTLFGFRQNQGYRNDSPLESCMKRTWNIKLGKLHRVLKKPQALRYESEFKPLDQPCEQIAHK